MNELEIIDGNKLIIKDRDELKPVEGFMEYADGYLSEIITWNDLMPVVKKIKETLVKYDDEKRHRADRENIITHYSIMVPLEDCYRAVIAFIKWHNENSITP